MGACSRTERAGFSWSIDFACAEEAARTQQVKATIAEDDCEAQGALRYEEQITRGGVGTATAPGALAPGRYAFSALAVDDEGAEIASACVSVTLPSATPIRVTLFGGRTCEADGGVTIWPDDGAVTDAGVGPEVDGAPPPACGVTGTDADMTPDCDLTVDAVVGGYERLPVENNWHVGRIEQTANGLVWVNSAGVQWTLIPDLGSERLLTTSDCPYYTDPEGTAFVLVLENGRVTGFWFNTELYSSSL